MPTRHLRESFCWWKRLAQTIVLAPLGWSSQCYAAELPAFGTGNLDWVPTSAETLVITKGPCNYRPPLCVSEQSVLDAYRSGCLGPLAYAAKDDWFSELMKHSVLLMSIDMRMNFNEPSANLRSPQVEPHNDVTVLLFQDPGIDEWSKIISAIRARAHQKIIVGERDVFRDVYCLSFNQRKEAPDLFVSSPCNGLLICSSRLDVLEEIEKKLPPKKIKEILTSPNSILANGDWFGERRYVKGSNSWASPLSKGSGWSDDEARGFTMKILSGDKVEWSYYSGKPDRASTIPTIKDLIVKTVHGEGHNDYVLSAKDYRVLYFWTVNLLGPSFYI